ncbi:shikimate kinase [Microbacterium sp. cx-59]|uniref:shikimate kinase n=1 Tax=Microbacterium sp. cx-59 TaxID=2891207 RepID=UPI001E3FA68F|nr:shikimate kinase [Microbacterium sp. cx-59]MCC4907353.1 (d)CMP kinase [Microbacterium sp. cx-59]
MSAAADPALVLVGPMGAGKSSLGRRVARTLGVPFVDTDSMIVRQHGPIPELFRSHGEPHFRALERDAVVRALAAGGVVSLGGGSVLDAQTRDDLRAHRVAFLTVDRQVVAQRIAGGSRPLLAGGTDPVEEWERIFTARRPLYEEVADAVFDTSRGPLADVVESIATWAATAVPRGTPV